MYMYYSRIQLGIFKYLLPDTHTCRYQKVLLFNLRGTKADYYDTKL